MPKTTETDYKNKDFTDYFLLFVNSGRPHEFHDAFKKLVEDAKNIEDVFPELFKSEIPLTEKLQKEVRKRYQHIDQMVDDLRNVMQNLQVYSVKKKRPSLFIQKIRKHTVLIGILISLFAVFLIFTRFWTRDCNLEVARTKYRSKLAVTGHESIEIALGNVLSILIFRYVTVPSLVKDNEKTD